MSDAQQSLEQKCSRTKVTVTFEITSLRETPYSRGAGFWNPYKVTLSSYAQRNVEVIALLDNMIQQPTAHHMLYTLSSEVDHLKNAKTFEEWVTVISHYGNSDARYVHKPYEGNEPEMLQRSVADQLYLKQRYSYLDGLAKTLQDFFGSDYTLFSEYWFRHVLSDWSEWPYTGEIELE